MNKDNIYCEEGLLYDWTFAQENQEDGFTSPHTIFTPEFLSLKEKIATGKANKEELARYKEIMDSGSTGLPWHKEDSK